MKHINIIPILILALIFPLSGNAQTTVGVVTNTPEAVDGYTLVTPMAIGTTFLINNCGEVVNSWESDFRPGLASYLLEDGSLIRTAQFGTGLFTSGGNGGRIEHFDWEGNLIWEFDYSNTQVRQHHDIEVLPNGNVLVLAWELITPDEALAAGRNPTFIGDELWPDHVVEVDPTITSGNPIVWEWHSWDHLVQDYDPTKPNYGVVSDHPELINLNYIEGSPINADWMHCNGIDYNPELDQIVISSRNFNEFWVIDHSTTTEEAASHSGGNSGKGGDILYRWGNPYAYGRGTLDDKKLFSQHDANWIKPGYPGEGGIMVFNNGPDRMYSTVEVVRPPIVDNEYEIEGNKPYGPEESEWIYEAPDPFDFYSKNISGANRLPNGNTLICEGALGKLFEVDLAGNIVWEYINPLGNSGPSQQGFPPSGNNVFKANKYLPDFSGFDGKDLTPGSVIETGTPFWNCELYNATSIAETEADHGVHLIMNPVVDQLIIENQWDMELQGSLWTLTGKQIMELDIPSGKNASPIGNIPNGVYFLQFSNRDGSVQGTLKLVVRR